MSYTELEKRVSKLCELSLEEKWYADGDEGLMDACPFCAECNLDCKYCDCPTEICGNKAKWGFIAELHKKYANVKVREIDKDDLEKMINLFKEHIIKE